MAESSVRRLHNLLHSALGQAVRWDLQRRCSPTSSTQSAEAGWSSPTVPMKVYGHFAPARDKAAAASLAQRLAATEGTAGVADGRRSTSARTTEVTGHDDGLMPDPDVAPTFKPEDLQWAAMAIADATFVARRASLRCARHRVSTGRERTWRRVSAQVDHHPLSPTDRPESR
jgi:hypothetical protein